MVSSAASVEPSGAAVVSSAAGAVVSAWLPVSDGAVVSSVPGPFVSSGNGAGVFYWLGNEISLSFIAISSLITLLQ